MTTHKTRKKRVQKKGKTPQNRKKVKKTSSGCFFDSGSSSEEFASSSRRRKTWMPAGKDFRTPFGYVRPLRISVTKDLQWVLPFLEKTHQILPRLQMPVKINGYKPSLTRSLRTLGTSYYDEGVINLVTHKQVFGKKHGRNKVITGLRKISKSEILETLAHELAHFHVVEHNFEHSEMTRTIFRTFGLKKLCTRCDGSGELDLDCNPH
jgi:hypothetical protein